MPGLSQDYDLLCEGFQDTFVPEVSYVCQQNKVCFLRSPDKGLNESIAEAAGLQVVESVDDLETVEVLDEKTGKTTKTVKNGLWVVEGPYQRSDVKNANKRTYPRKIWERDIANPKSEVQERIKARGMVGHLEHPKDGRSDAKESALVVTSLDLKEDGVVWGKSELLDTPNGRILQELTAKNVRWGISSRGNGSVRSDGTVNEDYKLVTFDGVMAPSTLGAYPKPVQVADGKNESTEKNEATTADSAREAQELVERVEALTATTVESMDRTSRHKLMADLLDSFGAVGSLSKSGALKQEKANDLQNWLTRKLKAVHESVPVTVGAVIGDVIDEAAEVSATEAEAIFRRTVENLSEKMQEAESDNATLREQVSELHDELAEAAEEHDTAVRHKDELVHELSEVQSRLDEATTLIAELSQESSDEEDDEEVELEVEEDTVEESDEPEHRGDDQVVETADEVPVRRESRGVSLLANRPTLPVGKSLVSESLGNHRVAASNPSRGARLAGAVMKKRK